MGSKIQQRVGLRMASLQERGGGFSGDASMERRQAEVDAVYGEAGGIDAQGLDDGRVREDMALEV